MKANNYEAVKGNVQSDWGVKIPTEINELESHLYHVLFVVREHNAERETYDTKPSVRKFPHEAWFSVKDQVKSIGYKYTFILHDPSKPIEVAKPKGKQVEAVEPTTED